MHAGANTFTSLDTMPPYQIAQAGEPMFSMGTRLRNSNKKQDIRREANAKIYKEKPRKSLFYYQ